MAGRPRHNHFFWDEPRMYYVHGHGTPAERARKVRPALDLIGRASATPAAAPAASAAAPAFDASALSKMIGAPVEQTGAVYRITIRRADLKLTEMGAPINATAWAAIALAFVL